MALADYINEKPTIRTDRLIIRPMTEEDVPALKEWMSDKSIYTYWGKGPSKAELNPELLFEKEEKPTKSFHLGVALKDDDKVVGDLWVYLIEKDIVWLQLQSDYQKEFMDVAMEQKPLWQLQDSVLSIQNLEGFGQKLMFEMLHLVES